MIEEQFDFEVDCPQCSTQMPIKLVSTDVDQVVLTCPECMAIMEFNPQMTKTATIIQL